MEHQELREKVRQAIASQPYKTVTVLSSLLAVQDALGYLPEEAIQEVALASRASVNDVWGVASFYTNFRFAPPAEHTVELCWGPSCQVRGAMEVIQSVLGSVGLSNEGDTPDGRISLRLNTCLGACSHAPAVSLDHRILGDLTPEKALAAVEELKDTGGDAHRK